MYSTTRKFRWTKQISRRPQWTRHSKTNSQQIIRNPRIKRRWINLNNQTNRNIASTYWQWYFLPLPAPFPERLIGADPDYYFENCLVSTGGRGLESFDSEMLAEYRRCWRDPAMIHASCCDYRAGRSVDLAHDEADLHVKLQCPVLALWGVDGLMCQLMDVEAAWRARCHTLRVGTVPGGHWFPEHSAPQTAAALTTFFAAQQS